MRDVLMLVATLLLAGCGAAPTPCLPSGELRFFLSRGLSCAPLAGTLNVASDGKSATLNLENGFSGACSVSGSDNRQQNIGVCQMTFNCRQACAACEGWLLSIRTPGDKGGLWSGEASSDLPSCSVGRWSAAP